MCDVRVVQIKFFFDAVKMPSQPSFRCFISLVLRNIFDVIREALKETGSETEIRKRNF